MNNKMRTVIILALCITLLLSVGWIMLNNFHHYSNTFGVKNQLIYYDSVADCINDSLSSFKDDSNDDSITYDKLIYEYEDNENIAQLFSTKDNNIWFYVIDKNEIDGKVKYSGVVGGNAVINDDWLDIYKPYAFKLTSDLNNKETYNGIEPIVKEISFTKEGKEQTGYLLFVKIPNESTENDSLSQTEKP